MKTEISPPLRGGLPVPRKQEYRAAPGSPLARRGRAAAAPLSRSPARASASQVRRSLLGSSMCTERKKSPPPLRGPLEPMLEADHGGAGGGVAR
jgi:hypothetical protein